MCIVVDQNTKKRGGPQCDGQNTKTKKNRQDVVGVEKRAGLFRRATHTEEKKHAKKEGGLA
jgi:hypothetical protein